MKKIFSLAVMVAALSTSAPAFAETPYTCDLAPSAVVMPIKADAVYRSAQWWNNLYTLTNRTLDRSICKDVERVWAPESPLGTKYDTETVTSNRRALMRAAAANCQSHLMAEGVENASMNCGKAWMN